MQTEIRIDKTSYGITSFSGHQSIALREIYELLELTEEQIDIFFVFDVINTIFSAYLIIDKHGRKVELPYIAKKNRRFYLENLIVCENFLLPGENSIYLFHKILKVLGKRISLSQIRDYYLCFEMDDNIG